MAKLIHAERLEIDHDGDLVMYFRSIDALTQKPTGDLHGPSSPIVKVEPLVDSQGNVTSGKQVALVIRTQSGSVYVTSVNQPVATRLTRITTLDKALPGAGG